MSKYTRRGFLRAAGLSLASTAVPSLLSGGDSLPAQRTNKPNIVFVLADDLGYADLGCYGRPDIKTPVIDSIAAEGVRFTQYYSNGPECTPTRTAFMIGRYQQRVGGLECAIGTGNVGRYDDAIRLAHANNLGLPGGFVETNLSSAVPTIPEITVRGNGVSISDGDTTPSAADWTDFGSVAQGGATITRTFTVRNDGTAALTLGAVTVPAGFTLTEGLLANLAAGASDTFTVQLDTATAGTWAGDISFSTNDSDENPFNYRITGQVTGGTPAMPPAERFTGGSDSFDLANKALLFTPSGSGYSFTVRPITALPTDPAGGTTLMLGDDSSVGVTLGSGKTVALYGQSYGSFYVGSNGYITFTQPDTDYSETLADHFDTPRISALFDDLSPSEDSIVSWKQLSDRVVVTWQAMTEYGTGSNTMQVEMYFDGRIQIA